MLDFMLQYNLEVYGLTYQYILHLNDYKILLYKPCLVYYPIGEIFLNSLYDIEHNMLILKIINK